MAYPRYYHEHNGRAFLNEDWSASPEDSHYRKACYFCKRDISRKPVESLKCYTWIAEETDDSVDLLFCNTWCKGQYTILMTQKRVLFFDTSFVVPRIRTGIYRCPENHVIGSVAITKVKRRSPTRWYRAYDELGYATYRKKFKTNRDYSSWAYHKISESLHCAMCEQKLEFVEELEPDVILWLRGGQERLNNNFGWRITKDKRNHTELLKYRIHVNNTGLRDIFSQERGTKLMFEELY